MCTVDRSYNYNLACLGAAARGDEMTLAGFWCALPPVLPPGFAPVGRVAAGPLRLGPGGVHEVQDVRDLPRPVREASGHRGGALPVFLAQ